MSICSLIFIFLLNVVSIYPVWAETTYIEEERVTTTLTEETAWGSVTTNYKNLSYNADGTYYCDFKNWPCLVLEDKSGRYSDTYEVPRFKTLFYDKQEAAHFFNLWALHDPITGQPKVNHDGSIVGCNKRFSGDDCRELQFPQGTKVIEEFTYLGTGNGGMHFYRGHLKVIDSEGRTLAHPRDPEEKFEVKSRCSSVAKDTPHCARELFIPINLM